MVNGGIETNLVAILYLLIKYLGKVGVIAELN